MRDRSTPLTDADTAALDWERMGGLIPAIVQDPRSGRVLMLGYMNKDALAATLKSGLATFFSRARKQLWEKGETSGNRLKVRAIFEDCDADALLVLADPEGPTCHLGTPSCFGAEITGPGWLAELSEIISQRARSGDAESYTHRLLDEGPAGIAQKIGEEGVEVALAAVTRDKSACAEEAADLLYHLGVLMQARSFGWEDVIDVLRERHAKASK
ncbi:MAG TPA: bifunctional phosphoribosyl-AMP cyclohydrolase/phosphoribosyl-ATP diphosphatase HisIE [Sphingomicrobium sp.]|nr:bifunctional phosphoribosyl-AMP cyclohydrolase/phosphoribosyl-ATP diphosphatase HisIE [Sphingomicrobium sp.]